MQSVVEQCQRALELLATTSGVDSGSDDEEDDDGDGDGGTRGESSASGSLRGSDREADELCDLLKSKVQCADFLEKLESAQATVPQNMTEEGNSWDMVGEKDLWECESDELEQEDYVLVRQEDIVEGIACFMAAYLLSLKQTKDLTPNQLQDALSKTFSVKKKKGKLRKAWDGSKVIYNVASWGATALG